jgi:hypothetical protein
MNRKKKIYVAVLLLCVVIIVIAFVIISINETNKNDRKGGEDAENMFTIGSSELSISDGSKTVILSGEDRKAVVKIMQNIIGNAEDATDKNAEYDITIDFKNGYKAYISSDKMLFRFDAWDKRMDEQNLKTLLSYLNS